jgi:hypothetical protein
MGTDLPSAARASGPRPVHWQADRNNTSGGSQIQLAEQAEAMIEIIKNA